MNFVQILNLKYPDIKNVVRLKNKFDKRILVNYIYYSIDEYLAPVQVLICSKCAHCGSNHKSTSASCPIIKAYRA